MLGVIDRIEDGIAVILIEAENKEWTVAEDHLPTDAKEGTILQLEVVQDTFNIIRIDEEATKSATAKATSLQNKLQAKKKRSKFKRK